MVNQHHNPAHVAPAEAAADRPNPLAGDPVAKKGLARLPILAGSLLGLIGLVLWLGAVIAEHEVPADARSAWLGSVLGLTEKLGEFILLVACLHFVYEVFAKRTEQAIFREELHEALAGDLKVVQTIADDLGTVVSNTSSSLNMVSYLDSEVFKPKWISFAERHGTVLIIGDFPDEILSVIETRAKHSGQGDAPFSFTVYCCVGTSPPHRIKRLIELCDTVKAPNSVRVYHLDRFDLGGLIFGTDLSAVTVEALLDFSASRGDRPIGYHVFGQAALMLLTSIRTRLTPPEAPSLPGNWTTPVRIVSAKDVNFLIERRETYCQAINTLYEGEPVVGKSTICDRMSRVLGESKQFLDVTHIASSGSTIDVVADAAFQEWLSRNYAAARGDGRARVRVRRLFMISREHKGNATLERMMREIVNGGVEVYYLYLDEISPAFHEDFSLYDDRDVIFVRYQGRGGWIPESEARHSRNPATITAFRRIFDLAIERAKRFTPDQACVPTHVPTSLSASMHSAASKPS